MTDLVILVGPVSAGQLGTVAWLRPTKVVTLGQGPSMVDKDGVARTIGPAAFAALWNTYGSVEAVAASAGIPAGELGAVGLIAFSAGWAFADPALQSGRVDGALLLDACFAEAAGFSTLVKSGYASFAQKAADGSRLLVMTGGQGGRYHTGAACVWQHADRIGGTWSDWTPPAAGPAPVRALETGELYLAEYPSSLAHGAHVTTLGPVFANALLAPWLAGGARSAEWSVGALLAGLGAAITAGLVAFTWTR